MWEDEANYGTEGRRLENHLNKKSTKRENKGTSGKEEEGETSKGVRKETK